MRLTRNPLLAATLAITALAFMASSALAQIEVVAEDGAHCGAITEEADHNISGGCEITATSTSNPTIFAHTGVTEAATASCETELTGNTNEDGIGFIDVAESTIHTNPATGCGIVACEEAAPSHTELEWPVSGMAEIGSERAGMLVTFCIVPTNAPEGTRSACTIIVHATMNFTTHVTSFSADEEPCHENHASELSGSWSTAGSTNEVETIHNHYPGVN